uniref:Calmodulin-lysine N-methyltransferase n=1 Tax=Onchocerca volvulus TaxID=6282 RepID=A0A2K6VHF3_ONCVO
MDDMDLGKEDRNDKQSIVSGEDLSVVSNKRPKEEEEKSPSAEISKHEKLLSGAEVSKARQRWNLLSHHLRSNDKKPANNVTTDVEARFVVFEAFFIPKHSNTGRWFHLKSPVRDIEFDIHIYSAVTITPSVLTGFNNSGNIRIWPSEECLAYYLLKHERLVRGKTILELGSGMVGLSGLTSAALGATEVVLTDGNEKSVENIRRIIEMNKLSNHVTCSVLFWNIALPNRQFDAILCADCLFFTEEHCTLLNCIYQHLKPGGIAYIVAPDRSGTVRGFLDLVCKERKRWRNYQEIVDAIHYSCMLIEDEIVEELEKKGQKMEFDKEVVAQVAFAISDTLCKTWPNELLQYAKHARRSVVNISDLTLLFRKNESMLSLIGSIVESSLLPVRKRQSRKGANKKNAKAANSSEKMDNENSNDVDNLIFEKNALKLTDFWNQPSTSQERPLLLSETFKHSSSMEQKCMSSSISLQKKEVAKEKKETLSCYKQKANAITGSRKTENSRKRRNQITKQWLQPSFDLDSSKSGEEQQSEFLDINVSPPCYSSKKDLLEQESQFDTGSFSKTNEIVRGAANLCKKAKMNEKNVMVSLLKFDDEMIAESSTTDADRETTSHKRTNKTDRNETESQVGNLSDGKSIFSPETSVLNSVRRISKEQLTNTSSRNRSSTADDCFSSFKFESDDEDSGQNCSLLENEGKLISNTLSCF